MEFPDIHVVLIEDDPMVQEVNRQFVERVNGFRVVGAAGNGKEGLQLIRELKPDLVILDIYMPSLDGGATIEQIRHEKLPVDVIAITAAKDAETIREMLRGGVVDYIVKPFKFERVEQSLIRYREARSRLSGDENLSQAGIDRILAGTGLVPSEPISSAGSGGTLAPAPFASDRETGPVRSAAPAEHDLPKGLHAVTLRQVQNFMQTRQGAALSAEEVADGVGIARVTARRYLEYMEKSGQVTLDVRYGGVGRPVNRYALATDKR